MAGRRYDKGPRIEKEGDKDRAVAPKEASRGAERSAAKDEMADRKSEPDDTGSMPPPVAAEGVKRITPSPPHARPTGGADPKETAVTGAEPSGVPIHEMHAHERDDVYVRHMSEHNHLRARHEREHSMRVHGAHHEELAAMHERHHKERQSMHSRQEREYKEMYARHAGTEGGETDQGHGGAGSTERRGAAGGKTDQE